MTYQERFSTYFQRPVAVQATRSLSNSCGIEFRIAAGETHAEEVFHFTRQGGANRVVAGASPHPEIVFSMLPSAAEELLGDSSEDVGTVGINVIRQILSPEPAKKISISLKEIGRASCRERVCSTV